MNEHDERVAIEASEALRRLPLSARPQRERPGFDFRGRPLPVTPDAGDASDLAHLLARADGATQDYDGDWSHLARAILASDWLAAHVSAAATKTRAEERAAVDAVLVCPHNPSGRHYYALDATCQRCEMPSWVEAAVRTARLAPDTAGGDR